MEFKTDLINYIKDNNLKGLKELVCTKDADIEKVIHSGLTPLMYAFLYSKSLEIIDFLALSKESFFVRDDYGNSLLHIIVKTGNIRFAEFLLDIGLDVNSVNDNLETPLQYACFWSDFEMVKFLVDNGADINYIGEDGRRVIDWAIQFSTSEIVKFLVYLGVDVNEKEVVEREVERFSKIIHIICSADKLLLDNHYDDALSLLLGYMPLDPDNFRLHYNIAKVYEHLEKYSDQERYLRNVILINPELEEAWFDLGFSLYSQKRTLECIDIWQKSINRFGLREPDIGEELAELYYMNNQLDKALELSLCIIDEFDDLIFTYRLLGQIYILKKDAISASHYLEKFLDILDVKDEIAIEDRELCNYLNSNNFNNFNNYEKLYTLISDIFGKEWKYYLKEDDASKIMEGLEATIDRYVKNNDLSSVTKNWIDFVSERKTYDSSYFYYLVQSLWELDLKDEYFQIFEDGIPHRFEDKDIYSSHAMKCFDLKDYDNALIYYLKALELEPEIKLKNKFASPYEANSIYFFIALCYRELQQPDNAIIYWYRAIELDYSEDEYLRDKTIDYYSYLAVDLESMGKTD